MQESPSTTPLSEPENRLPDSLDLDLTATLVSSDGTDVEQIDLYLSIDFHEQQYSVNTGRVKFGFKGGELKIRVENGTLSPDDVLCSPEKTSESQPIEYRVTTEEKAQYYTWVWQGKTDSAVLQGSLSNLKLGTVQVTGKPCCIEAVFSVSPSDVYLISAEGLWLHTITPNQLAVLDRKLVLFLLESELQPYLSRVEWLYDEHQGLQRLSQRKTSEPKRSIDTSETGESAELADVIKRAIASGTDNFLELAEIVGLNPLVDFAGAKLLGVNLSGLDLSTANLRGAYLRGADLSDTDLSGTNLHGANLGGADLSGAYLSDADLSNTQWHRASLALANLSAANLSGANLSEANLSNANLSNANLRNANLSDTDLHQVSLTLANLSDTTWSNSRVEEARFSRNTGLSEEQKQDLKQRGAIFED